MLGRVSGNKETRPPKETVWLVDTAKARPSQATERNGDSGKPCQIERGGEAQRIAEWVTSSSSP